jgi:parvulin-like peptidyl-prolyl isomerase
LADPSLVGQQVIEDITNDLLIRQYARANEIVVTEVDVEKAIQDAYGYYPDGTPTPAPTGTPLTYPTWSATQYSLMTPTGAATLAPSETPPLTQTPDLTATATTIPSLTPTATATTVPSLTPTATPYTLDGFQSRYQEGLSFYAKLGMTEADIRKIYFESPLYRKRVTDIVTANVAHEQEQVWARTILVADEATAQSIREQLLVGADFPTLAAANSLDTTSKDKGGDLGWFGKGKMPIEFETAALALQVGEISQPVQTTSDWFVIQVLGHEIRPLTDTEYKAAVTAAINQWLTDHRTGANIVISGTWTANLPDQPSLQSAFNDLYATATANANQVPQQPTPTP